MRFLSAKWKALLDGPGNRCDSGGRDVRSCFSTTSLDSSSTILSSKPSLFFTSRQREGEFFKQGCGEKGTTSLSPCSGPSGTNVPLSLFQAEMLNDPEFAKNVKGLEGMLRVRERLGESSRVCVPVPHSALHHGTRDARSVSSGGRGCASCPAENSIQFQGTAFDDDMDTPSLDAGCCGFASCVVENTREFQGTAFDDGMDSPSLIAGRGGYASCAAENTREFQGTDWHDDLVTLSSKKRAVVPGAFGGAAETAAHATAGQSEEIIGLHVSPSSLDNSSNSRGCVAAAACALLPAVPGVSARVCPVSSSSAVSAAVAHARFTPMHDAHNSWSDTGRVTGPTGTKRVKGGVSGPAEDLRPVSEVEAGVNFRPAGGVRGQVAGSLPRRQPGAGTRRVREGVVTPSLHPEVSGIQFVSPGRGLDIRQSMGWTKVCSTALSGIWVLKGNARARMLPENLDHLRVEWISRGTYETAWIHQGTTVCVHTSMDVEQLSDHKLMTPSGMGLLVCGAGSRPFCHPGVAGGNCQRV